MKANSATSFSLKSPRAFHTAPCHALRPRSRCRTVAVKGTVLTPRSWKISATSATTVLETLPQASPQTPVLLSKLVKAHSTRVLSLLVLKDRPDCKTFVSAGLDKTLGQWKMTLKKPKSSSNGNGHATIGHASNGHTVGLELAREGDRHVQATRLTTHAAVFSIVRQPQPPAGSVFTPTADVLYVGNAAKEVVAWEVRASNGEEEPSAVFQTVATDYTGWVRSLALMGKWLFSCGCNYLVQHDTSFPIPKEVSKQELFKGDIQAIVTSTDHVFIASSDGTIRSWKVSKTGAMTPAGDMPGAHSSRITGLALHGSTLYSASLDGSIRAWHADSLALLAAVPAAHGGDKVHAIVVGADGLLYTGGDDKMIRSWRPLSPALDFLAALEPVTNYHNRHNHHQLRHMSGEAEDSEQLPTLPAAGPPLAGHEASVRVLAAGSAECLVSGDSDGDMCIWALPR